MYVYDNSCYSLCESTCCVSIPTSFYLSKYFQCFSTSLSIQKVKCYDLKATKVIFWFIYPVKRDISIRVINISIIRLLLGMRRLKVTLSKF